MKKNNKLDFILVFSISALSFLTSCNNSPSPALESTPRGEPILRCDTLVFDENSRTFSLKLKTDSTADAKLHFQLLMDGDNILQESSEGYFSGILPFDNGYDVILKVEWPDTTITRQLHVVGFVEPIELVDKMTEEELKQLIISNDQSLKRGTNDHLSQSVSIKIIDCQSQTPPTMLRDVIGLLDRGEWESVEVIDLEYDSNNQITAITLKPIGEHLIVINENDYDLDF